MAPLSFEGYVFFGGDHLKLTFWHFDKADVIPFPFASLYLPSELRRKPAARSWMNVYD